MPTVTRIVALSCTAVAAALLSLLVLLAASSAHAQAGATQPGQIERQFRPPPQPRSQAGRFEMPLPAQTPPPGSEGVKFRLRGLVLEGMTVYEAESWSADYSRLLGRQVTLGEIYAFANELTRRYRNDGYLLSQVVVPAQAVEDGVVKLLAVEGYVAEVRFEGTETPLLRRHAQRIRAERPLTAATLERYLLLMNDVPGTFARAALVPSATAPGASDLIVQLNQVRFSASLGIDNRGGRALGPVRTSLELEQRGLLGWGDRTSLRVVAAERDELEYLALAHEEALDRDGMRGSASFSRVRSRPDTGTGFIALDLQTQSDSATLGISRPVERSRASNLSWRAALTGHNGKTLLFGMRESEDRVRALRLGLTYDRVDAARGVNLVDLELAHGFEGLGSSRAGDAQLSRANGNPAFTKLGLYVARLQSFGASWSLLGALGAQVAFDDLLASELFSFGGEPFGRGYDPSELTGDDGAAAKLELRYSLAGAGGFASLGVTVYGFYDAGFVRQRSSGGLKARQSATSAGLGARFEAGRLVTGYLEVAKPLTRDVAAEGDRDLRAYGGLQVRF